MATNYFIELNSINCNDKVEDKNGLTYLSWAYSWAEVKKIHPDATYTIYENAQGWNYHTDGRTCWVKTGVTINGIEHIEYLPVMDFKNQSIPLERVTSFDVNKAIQRSLTKAAARHGLGLYIYAGEDLPEESDEAPKEEKPAKATKKPAEKPAEKKQAISKEVYYKLVECYANNILTKTGEDCRSWWIKNAKPTDAQIAQFDKEVDGYRAAAINDL